MNRILRPLIWLFFLAAGTSLLAQEPADRWADSILGQMTLDQKIGQLFVIRAHSNLGEDHVAAVRNQIKTYQVGGLCFFQGTPGKQAELTREYQALARVPLIVSMDAEWGLGMRFKEQGLSFPRQLTLGAIRRSGSIEEMGYAAGRQLRAIGVNVSFSPVADINNNPFNPVIGDRSFGEDREIVADHAIAYMKGLGRAGVLACGKHFPGHGDTDVDSHLDLPVIKHDMKRLRDVELYPFHRLIEEGLPSVMVAHLHVPAIDATEDISTTLSPKAVNRLLREVMGFQGLVFTDALEMKGVTKHFKPGEVAVMAFKAGNDMLVLPDNLDASFNALKKALQKGDISETDLDIHVRRILHAKYALGLERNMLPDPAEAERMAFDPQAVAVKHKLIEQALTVAQNKMALIPLLNLSDYSYATVALGASHKTIFQQRIDSYLDAVHFQAPASLTRADSETLRHSLKSYRRVIVTLQGMTNKAANQYGLTREEMLLVQNLQREHELILVIFGSPYSLQWFENIDHILVAYEDNKETQDLAAQGLVGVFSLQGRLPVTASPVFPVHHGYSTPSLGRLGFTVPERVGMIGDSLAGIRDIAQQMIRIKAAPGCEILIAREGRIVFHEAFGTHTYEETMDSVRLTNLYDIASITKVAATTASVMRLQQEGKIDIDNTLGDYLPWLAGSDKAPMVIRDVMAHHAGLKSWIEFFKRTVRLENNYWLTMEPGLYSDEPSPRFCLPVAEDMYMDARWLDTIRQEIIESPLNARGTYVYSDLGFIMLSEIIHRVSGAPIERYVDSVFFHPMGLRRILYNPLERFPIGEIAPTEIDNYFRCQPLQGHVHDMASAMLGGVSGHAGLFADAMDLAAEFQMMLNGGTYGGTRYLDSMLLRQWTMRWGNSTRRGIGFDMKELNPDKTQLMSRYASSATYGHTGFTGDCVWVDPENGLLYVFLSNRTYPDMNNPKLRDNAIRERIHTRAYKAIRGFTELTAPPPG